MFTPSKCLLKVGGDACSSRGGLRPEGLAPSGPARSRDVGFRPNLSRGASDEGPADDVERGARTALGGGSGDERLVRVLDLG
jgi:hypothetical protein